MTRTIVPIESDEQWHQLRASVVGASEAGALLGIHPYQTYWGLWALKSRKLTRDEDSGVMKRGRILEPVAIDLIREQFPDWVIDVPRCHYSDAEYGLGCTPDLLARDEQGVDGSIQIKTVSPLIFRKEWRGESDVVTPPLWIAVQALLEAHLTGAKWAKIAALVVDHEINLHIIDVPVHQSLIETLQIVAQEFWVKVIEDVEPDPDYMRDGEAIRNMLRKADGSEIDLSQDNELPELLEMRQQRLDEAKQAKEEADAISAQLLHRLGPAAIARFNGGYISAKTINRKSYTVAASSHRQLRVVLNDEERMQRHG